MELFCLSNYYKPAYIYGGPTRSLSSLCEGLAELGVDVTVFTTNANGPKQLDVPTNRPLSVDGVKVWYFHYRFKGSSFFFSPEMARVLNYQAGQSQPDLFLVQSIWGNGLRLTAKICNSKNMPFIVSTRGQLNRWALNQKRVKKSLYYNLFAKRYLNSAVAFHCTDPSEADAVNTLGLSPPTFVIPNGVNSSDFDSLPERGVLRSALGIPKDAFVFLFLGRLHRNKRPDLALDALAAAHSYGFKTHLIFAGPDEESIIPKLKGISNENSLSDHVHFTGLLEDGMVLQALTDADLLLMPSGVQESYGRSAVEAMAAGLPVLVSENVPVGRYITKFGAGKVVPCTRNAFRDIAIQMINNRDHLRTMGNRGREVVSRFFDSKSVAQQMLKQIDSILSTGYPASD